MGAEDGSALVQDHSDLESLFGGEGGDEDSLFGGSDYGDEASPFTEDPASSSPQPSRATSLLSLSPPPETLCQTAGPASLLTLPPLPSEAARTTEAQYVSTFPADDQSPPDSELELELLRMLQEDEQAIDAPQVGSIRAHDAQEGQGCAPQQLKAIPAVIRPRQPLATCHSAPLQPPPRIDLKWERKFDDWVPFIQFREYLTAFGCLSILTNMKIGAAVKLVELHKQFNLSEENGKRLVDEAKSRLASRDYSIYYGGQGQAPVALRGLKVSMLLAAVSILKEEGMGEEYFGINSATTPRSKHVWPYDSSSSVDPPPPTLSSPPRARASC